MRNNFEVKKPWINNGQQMMPSKRIQEVSYTCYNNSHKINKTKRYNTKNRNNVQCIYDDMVVYILYIRSDDDGNGIR